MGSDLLDRIEFGKELVLGQVTYFKEAFGRVEGERKHDGSLVTEADLKLSQEVAQALEERYPEDQFFSEESDASCGPIAVAEGYAWLIDPIDGTNNFARALPLCAISLALLKNGEPVYGFVWDNISGKLYHGGENLGAFADEAKIQVEPALPSKDSMVAVQTSSQPWAIECNGRLQAQYKLRGFGSSTLHATYAGIGLVDAVVEYGTKVWDIAAGYAIIKGVKRRISFFGDDEFPLKTFDVKMKSFGFMAGDEAICASIDALLD